MNEDILVKKSRIQGTGIFATKDFEKGETICKMRGEIITFKELRDRYARGKEKICNPLQIDEKTYLDLAKPYVYFNHSCSPISGIRKKGELFALRKIKKGEEITYDYSTTEWTYEKFGKYKDWTMECTCSSTNCRGTLGQFPSLEPKLKKQYYQEGALQDFIFKKLEKKMFA